MPRIESNANLHTSTEHTVFDVRSEERFVEYRRKWNDNPRSFVVENFPLHLDIESTSACNLLCPFCARSTNNWGPADEGYLDFKLYCKIIDEGADNGLYAIKLSMRGEPLLHPKLMDMVSYAKQRGVLDVYFNTNATLLTEEKAHQLIDAGLDRISISFEGTTREQYEQYRKGADFEAVINNVKRLREIRDSRGVTHPQIRVQCVLLPELRETYDEYVNFWKGIADEVSYLDARKESSDDDHRGHVAEWACPFLWQRMSILWDGTLLPCAMWGVSDFDLLALGNVKDVSIREQWLGEKSTEARNLHRSGCAHHLEACDRCAYRATEIEKTSISSK